MTLVGAKLSNFLSVGFNFQCGVNIYITGATGHYTYAPFSAANLGLCASGKRTWLCNRQTELSSQFALC